MRDFGAWLIKLLVCVIIGNYLVRVIVRELRKYPPPGALTLPLGFLEILSYAVSYIMGFPGFIAIWLALKTAGRWSPHKTPPIIMNSFLIGNLLSVMVGIFLGHIFRSYLIDLGFLELFKKHFLLN